MHDLKKQSYCYFGEIITKLNVLTWNPFNICQCVPEQRTWDNIIHLALDVYSNTTVCTPINDVVSERRCTQSTVHTDQAEQLTNTQ